MNCSVFYTTITIGHIIFGQPLDMSHVFIVLIPDTLLHVARSLTYLEFGVRKCANLKAKMKMFNYVCKKHVESCPQNEVISSYGSVKNVIQKTSYSHDLLIPYPIFVQIFTDLFYSI